jgi:MscS family membrane protein
VWLFSRKTLEAIPDVYDEVNLVPVDRFLPHFLTVRFLRIRLVVWVVLALIFPIYRLTGFLGRLLRPLVVWWRRRGGRTDRVPDNVIPGAIRLLMLAIAIRWLIGKIELPLLERQFWWAITAVIAIVAVAWLLLLLNGVVERYAYRHLYRSGYGEIATMLRLVRRLADVLVIAAGGLVVLHYFGVDPTAALAGLGIGGIAVALAAQKTLENVVGGISIIFDKAVRVGDFLKLGDILGTVDYIGLRSTRIRTLDRTILSVPNGQIANVNIETLSARDKFWFHHFVGLRYETTSAQLRAIVDNMRAYLERHSSVDTSDTIRVRFFRLGPFSLDVEIFAYIIARDWEPFLETQQELLLGIMEIVERAGATIALPSQTLHLADSGAGAPTANQIASVGSGVLGAPRQGVGSM